MGVTVAFASGGRDVLSPSLALPGKVLSANRRQADLDTTLRPAELAPGNYVLRVNATLANGQTALKEIPITLR